MSRGTTIRYVGGLLAAVALVLLCQGTASAQRFKDKPCSPCHHPYYGYYPTCWNSWPAGWNAWNCGRGPEHTFSTDTTPRQPRPLNGEELIPPPKPDPSPMSRLFPTKLWR